MSEENVTETKTEETVKKASIPAAKVKELTSGIDCYEKASFTVVGHKNGVRLAVPRTGGVSRVYFYANNDYSLIPADEAIKVFSEDERKEGRKGGIMAEIDFSLGVEAAERALSMLVDVVRAAPAPTPKPKREKKAKAEPAQVAEATEQEATTTEEA